MRYFTIIITILIFSCTKDKENKLDYSDSYLWYNSNNTTGNYNCDVFYILPTCILDYTNSNGDTLHFANVNSCNRRKMMSPSFKLADSIFGNNLNFYSPYYRQLSLESWTDDSLIDSRFPFAFNDIKNSFNYFLNNINKGKPFIIAGFSQGGKCVVELLKTLNSRDLERLVAAYVIGYPVTVTDTLSFKQIKKATKSNDLGVTICYNSVSNINAINPILSNSALCINPINWSTEENVAILNDTTSIRVDKDYNVLLVDGLNEDKYYVPSLDYLFKKGNYHLQELYFYTKQLSENANERANAYFSMK